MKPGHIKVITIHDPPPLATVDQTRPVFVIGYIPVSGSDHIPRNGIIIRDHRTFIIPGCPLEFEP
mgnify:CR=1 FL=1